MMKKVYSEIRIVAKNIISSLDKFISEYKLSKQLKILWLEKFPLA